MAVNSFCFYVIGTPAPQGSKKAYISGGRAILVEQSAAVKPWRIDVANAAIDAAKVHGWTVCDDPIRVDIIFYLRRPRGHYTKGGDLRRSAPTYPDKKPDVDKLLRATLDGLGQANCIFTDDARVIGGMVWKRYSGTGNPTGAEITIWRPSRNE